MKRMKARYPGKCADCGRRFAAGTPIDFDSKAPRGRKAAHADCDEGSASDYGDYGSAAWNNRPIIEVRTGSGTFYQRAGGRCEDAPCCGCCTF